MLRRALERGNLIAAEQAAFELAFIPLADVSPGAVFWMEATDHATDNVGDTGIRALMFEPK